MALTPVQTIASLITITLFVPCIASILILFKERSKKEAAMIWVASWVVSFLVGGIVSQLHSAFGGDNGSMGTLLTILIFFRMTLATVVVSHLIKRGKTLEVAG